MDEADRLSLLALIVAVVALVVSSWQLAQQLFATATDGKRFCQGSVMGVWARKTRLSWRWSQIRFETKYTVPEIRMSSGVYPEAVAPNPGNEESPKPRLIYKIPVLGFVSEVFNGPPTDWHWYWEITSDLADLPLEIRRTTRPWEPVKPNSLAEAWSWRFVKAWDRSYSATYPNLDVVSWPSLLQHIYQTQIKSIRKIDISAADEAEEPPNPKKGKEDGLKYDEVSPYRSITPEERGQGEDRVIARLVECSWDLIPPDVVRPLARSTVGTMIVIAHRFGMSWAGDFEPSEGKLNASGSGHTLSSETIRGLGLVVKYDFHRESTSTKTSLGSGRGLNQGENLSPTITADKLHCGCLPIDPAAIRKTDKGDDIHLIDVSRKLDIHAFLSYLGIPSSDMAILRDKANLNAFGSPGRAYKHTLEEAVSLICPIPTLADSNARWIVWPFRSFRQPYTPTRQKEGLAELRDELVRYVADAKPPSKIMENRQDTVIKYLSKSPLEYLNILLEFHDILKQDRRHPSEELARRRTVIQQRILAIHKETSDVFANVPLPKTADDEDTNSFLIDLAAAQISLATRYGRLADDHAMRLGATDDLSESDTRSDFVKELARLYVKDLRGEHEEQLKQQVSDWQSGNKQKQHPFRRNIRKHLNRKGWTENLKHGEVPALWWTGIVRSACWWMASRIRLPESQIPSAWYDSQTPVYLT